MTDSIPKEFEYCMSCGGTNKPLQRSHFLKNKHVVREDYDYDDPNNYCYMDHDCHGKFEKLQPEKRIEFWIVESHKFPRTFRNSICEKFIQRTQYLLGQGPEVKVW